MSRALAMKPALVGLGANIDSPLEQISSAVTALGAHDAINLVGVSPIYRSAPMGPSDQPDFYNACAHLETSLTAPALLAVLQAFEKAQGRIRHRHWGERCIDLDLLLYAAEVIASDTLTVPHPGLKARDFVLRPLIDLLGPDYRLPSGETLSQCLRAAPDHRLQPITIELPTMKDGAHHG